MKAVLNFKQYLKNETFDPVALSSLFAAESEERKAFARQLLQLYPQNMDAVVYFARAHEFAGDASHVFPVIEEALKLFILPLQQAKLKVCRLSAAVKSNEFRYFAEDVHDVWTSSFPGSLGFKIIIVKIFEQIDSVRATDALRAVASDHRLSTELLKLAETKIHLLFQSSDIIEKTRLAMKAARTEGGSLPMPPIG